MSSKHWRNAIELYPYQKDGVQFVLDKKYALIGDEPGLGKTAQALKAWCDVGCPPLEVVCPAHLKFNWQKEIEKYVTHIGTDYALETYSQTKPLTTDGRKFLIVDEAHYIKSVDTKRTLRIHDYVNSVRPDYCVLLSGTPIKNRVPEFYSPLYLLSETVRRKFPSYGSFGNYFCVEETVRYGNQTDTRFGGVRANRVEELKALLKTVMIRRKSDSVLNLPPINQRTIWCEYGNEFNEDLRTAWEAFNSGKTGRDITAKKNSAIAKAPFTAKFVYDMVSDGHHPMVVFSDHPDAVKEIYERLLGDNVRVRKVDSNTPMSKRGDYVEEFQKGEIEVLVASIGCFSDGWNGTAACRMVFNDLPWVSEDLVQCCRRIRRLGQTRPVWYYYVVGSEFDKYIVDLLTSKKELIKLILG